RRFRPMADDRTREVRARLRRVRARTEEATVAPKATLRFAVYALVGVVVGAAVAAYQWLALDLLLEHLLDAPLWVQAVAPGIGLVLTALALRAGRTTPATSDEYVRAYHTGADLAPRALVAKMAAAVATLGSGGAMGAEGPSVLVGAGIGQRAGIRLRSVLGPRGHRSLAVAGAAAGVAAIFGAPATGVLFALETPFQRDVARRALIPALVAAAASYLTFVSIWGVHSYLPVPQGEVRLRDEVFGAVILGVCSGIAARGLAWAWSTSKDLASRTPLGPRLLAATVVIGVVFAGARGLTGLSFTLGPGVERVAELASDPSTGLWVIAAAFALRALATSAVLVAGGVGGLFIPLVVQGLLLGRLVEALFTDAAPGLYPVIGLAAVLGAGYRTPLAAVMFVAETTGQAQFVIPALVATAVSQAVMGDESVAAYQVNEREGLLERRLRRPVRDVLIRVPILHPDEPVLEVIDTHGERPPAQALPVCDDGYRGLLFLRDLAGALFEHGPDATVADAMHDVAAVRVDVPAVEAARLMGELDSAVVAVVDEDGRALGVVTALTMTGALDYDPDD
ncbi:MAG TPA: chloride channel protein, partial [Acidimicrobiales bacterium]|nr:chloride channel protein [Acidimicrobiales bacterium]